MDPHARAHETANDCDLKAADEKRMLSQRAMTPVVILLSLLCVAALWSLCAIGVPVRIALPIAALVTLVCVAIGLVSGGHSASVSSEFPADDRGALAGDVIVAEPKRRVPGWRQLAIALLLALASIVIEGLCLFLHYILPPRIDVVGNSWSISIRPSTCHLTDLVSKRNATDVVATVRRASCAGPLEQGAVYYVVFVRRVSENNSEQNIVLQYVPGSEGYALSPAPEVAWPANELLKVSVRGEIECVVTRQSSINTISIRYSPSPSVWAKLERCP